MASKKGSRADNQQGSSKDNDLEPENIGELILKNTAVTMTSKGISNDLKDAIKLKMDFASSVYETTTNLASAVLSSTNKKAVNEALKEGGILYRAIDSTLVELLAASITINCILTSYLEKDQSLEADKKNIIKKDLDTIIDSELTKLSKNKK